MRTSPTLRSLAELEREQLVTPEQRESLARVAERYAVAITPLMAELISDAGDSIGRQFVPRAEELQETPDERADPIGDKAHEKVPGIVHRYPDRVLLKLVHSCAVYCRFCFRREMVGPGAEQVLGQAELTRALDYVAANDSIWEVVVTGGDPLIASPRRLAMVVERLAAIPHVRIVRFHTRIPVVAPARVTPEMVRALRHEGLTTWIVLHANHASEFTPEARAAIDRLVDGGIPMLSQSVLLKGINDDVATLGALMRAFVEARIRPYYLHHPDLAPGTGHFRLDVQEGQELMRQLRGHWSGLCQPTYVLDIPGGYGKSPIGPSYLEHDRSGYLVQDYRGDRHRYGRNDPID